MKCHLKHEGSIILSNKITLVKLFKTLELRKHLIVSTMITKVFVLCLIAGLSSADDRILDWSQLLGAGLGAGAGAVPGAATGGVLGILNQTITISN